MFENDPTRAGIPSARVARIVFGGILIAGAVLLYPASRHGLAAIVMPITWMVAGLVAIEFAALVVPSVGVVLMLPLLLHMPWAVFMANSLDGFDTWVKLSLVIVGPTHLVAAALVGLRAFQLTTGRKPMNLGLIYGVAI